ncbi:universal stress protein [Streptomyces sp. NPDC046939]|uniref:universal stress protein n=1 Tax=Streptomyces sp. NPDC046939 TaxID=3155376 RepID=UPI003411A147
MGAAPFEGSRRTMTHATGPLVVGVDGSPAALAALHWSVRQARMLRADILAVHAWEPGAPLRAPYAPVLARPAASDERVRARRLLDDTVRRVVAAEPGARLRALLIEGPPVRVLIDHTEEALLLVLGRHRRDDPALPALGAVARACMRRASCPVVAVPAAARPAAATTPELTTSTDGAAALDLSQAAGPGAVPALRAPRTPRMALLHDSDSMFQHVLLRDPG